MGIIDSIEWPSTAHDTQQSNTAVSGEEVKIAITPLKPSSDLPQHVVPKVPRSANITASQISAQLHVLSSDAANSAFPQGLKHSKVGNKVRFCAEEALLAQMADSSPGWCSWERMTISCLKLDARGQAESGICRYFIVASTFTITFHQCEVCAFCNLYKPRCIDTCITMLTQCSLRRHVVAF